MLLDYSKWDVYVLFGVVEPALELQTAQLLCLP